MKRKAKSFIVKQISNNSDSEIANKRSDVPMSGKQFRLVFNKQLDLQQKNYITKIISRNFNQLHVSAHFHGHKKRYYSK